MMVRVAARLAKGALVTTLAVSSAACFASAASLDEVRDDVASTRAETATADSVRSIQLVQMLTSLRDMSDSIASLSQRITRVRAETQADVRGMRESVNQILEVTGQSEARLRELRSQID